MEIIMSVFKNIFSKKDTDVPVIESIKTYKDVNLFLAGYKHYFKQAYSWYFSIRINQNDKLFIWKKNDGFFISDNYEPNIRAFIWNHKDMINDELKRRREEAELEEKEYIKEHELENEIEAAGI